MNDNEVAILVPLSYQKDFSESEKLSLEHLEHYLPEYDKYFLAPPGINITYGQIPVIQFHEKYFGSIKAHSRFCLSLALYNRFSKYKYILMHHLDCLVFKNNLSKWCEKGHDFIGPPWVKGPDNPGLQKEGVGNGGLSLRKVEAFQSLLSSDVKWKKVRTEMKNLTFAKSSIRRAFSSMLGSMRIGQSVNDHIEHYVINNNGKDDIFLYKYGKTYYPDFQVASVEEALQFGFETNPRICYERNNRELPFGVHRWEKYDKEFWKPFLLRGIV